MEKIFIRDFIANQTVSTTFLVKSKELRNKKTGGQFALLVLADRTGEISGQWWDNFEDSWDTFDCDDVVFARGLVGVHRNRLQLSVHRMRPCSEQEIDLTHYFPTTKYDVDEMFAELMAIIRDFRNPHLRQLLENIFAGEETVRKFKRAPAAKSMHHPYLGGLLEHTLSLMRLCRQVGAHYEGVDVDLLLTGAVLHDFGKIDELSYERGTNYTSDGQMIGHLVMETIMVAEHIRQIPGFPEELRRHVLHLLLAHHGRLEYGSPKLPVTPEALMLAYLDDLDSKIEAMQRLIAEPHAAGDWTRITPMFDRPIYRRRTIEVSTPPAQDNPAAPESDTGTGAGKDRAAEGKPAPQAKGFNNPFAQLAELMKTDA
ncbi:MAG TPA: HD domain-containing protein [Blastocatellia bacterium]|nr:HD domain-containing protein [Blastocatellia bacterium]